MNRGLGTVVPRRGGGGGSEPGTLQGQSAKTRKEKTESPGAGVDHRSAPLFLPGSRSAGRMGVVAPANWLKRDLKTQAGRGRSALRSAHQPPCHRCSWTGLRKQRRREMPAASRLPSTQESVPEGAGPRLPQESSHLNLPGDLLTVPRA